MSFENQLRTVLCTATKELHEIALFPSEALTGLEWKGRDDPVTLHDRRIEMQFRNALAPYKIGVIGEEYESTAERGDNLVAHIDPIDSTKSFIAGRHGAGVSVAVSRGDHFITGGVGDILSGLVYFTNGTINERIDSSTGKTAPLTVRSKLSKPLLLANNAAAKDAVALGERGYTTAIGSGFALKLAMVAAGSYDALIIYQKPNFKAPSTWDMAGGLALCQSAGVDVIHLDGTPFKMSEPFAGGLIAVWPDQRERLMTNLSEVRAQYRIK